LSRKLGLLGFSWQRHCSWRHYLFRCLDFVRHCLHLLSPLLLFVGSLQRIGGRVNIRRCVIHLRSSVLPQPNRDAAMQPVSVQKSDVACTMVSWLRLPQGLPRALGVTGHVHTARRSAGNQLRTGVGAVPQSHGGHCQSRQIPVHEGHCYCYSSRRQFHRPCLPLYA